MKKVFCIVLILVLVLSLGFTSFAEAPPASKAQDSAGLEQAILRAKAIVDIPEALSEFSYDTYQNSYSKDPIWNLYWNSPEGKGDISVTIDSTGNVCGFYQWEPVKEEGGLAKVTRAEAKVTADAFIKKAMPAYASDIREINADDNRTRTYAHVFNYMHYKNDVPVSPVNIMVEVNKYTGKVTHLSGLSGQPYPDFEAAEGLIDEAAAKEAWVENGLLKLQYQSWYDYDNEEMKVFLAYISKHGYYIDAQTGESLKHVDLWEFYNGADSGVADAPAAGAPESKPELSPEELEAVEGLSGLISKDEAVKAVKAKVPTMNTTNVKSASLDNVYYDKEKYQWSFRFENGSAAVDAKTGQLVSFRLSGESGKKLLASTMSEDAAKAMAEKFAKSAAPDQFQNCALDEDALKSINKDNTTATLNYIRIVDGIPFPNNSISVTLNLTSKKVIGYSLNWYDDVEFPSAEGVMTSLEALDYLDEFADFELNYTNPSYLSEDGGMTYQLVYSFMQNASGWPVDPFTGKILNYDGTPAEEDGIPEYTDLDGHWAKKMVEELLANNYYPVAGTDKFNPNQNITQEQFLRYLLGGNWASYDSESLYKRLQREGIVAEGEAKPDAAITRQEAAKYVIRVMDLEKAIVDADIYKNPFKDKISKEYVGYVALCYGLDILKGDDKGKFNGSKLLTNAQAASIVYNYLQQ